MTRFILALCLFLPSMVVAAHGEPPADHVSTDQSDTYPLIDKLLKDDKFEDALAASTKATLDHPGSARAYFLLGKSHFYREQDEPAKAAFSKAIELRPSFAEAYFFRGLVFNYGPDHAKRGVDFKSATELDPTKAKYWFELGKHYERQEKNEAAIPALERAAALDPKMASAWFALGTLASYRNEHERARLMWEKTLDIEPKHANAHYNLGQHHQLRGDAKVSLTHFLASLENKPDNVETAKKIVQAYYRLEDYEKAGIYRLKMFDLITRSADPTIRSMKEVCVDQFNVPGGRFFVFETVSKDASFFNWFTFKLVNEKGDIVKRINLEMNKALGEPIMLLGQNEGKVHTNFGIGFAVLPAYPALKELVLQAHDGKLKAAATTRFGE